MDSTQQENTETAIKRMTEKAASIWDKCKAVFLKIKSIVVAFFTATVRKIKNIWGGPPWVRYAVVAILIAALTGGIGYWRDRQLSLRIEALQTEVQVRAELIKIVEAEKDSLKLQIMDLQKRLTTAQITNDSNIKEAGKNAYQQTYKMPDSDVLYNFNLLIDGARKRNAER